MISSSLIASTGHRLSRMILCKNACGLNLSVIAFFWTSMFWCSQLIQLAITSYKQMRRASHKILQRMSKVLVLWRSGTEPREHALGQVRSKYASILENRHNRYSWVISSESSSFLPFYSICFAMVLSETGIILDQGKLIANG